jgi:DHA1 family chloramphenicol resistance protein-like MFS transporter
MVLESTGRATGTAYVRDRRTVAAFALLATLGALQAALGTTLPYLRADLGLGYRTASLHLSGFAVGGLVTGIAASTLQRAIARRSLVLLGTSCAAAGLALVGAAGTLAVSLAGSVLMGGGATLAFVGLWSGLSDQHGERRGVALTEGEVAVSAGNLVLPLVVGAAAGAGLGWRAAIVAVIAAVAVALVGLRRVGVQEPPDIASAPSSSSAGQTLRGLAPLLAVVACVVGVEWSLTTWLATYLDDEVGIRRALAVALTSVFFASMLAGRLLSSRLVRRRPARTVLLGAIGLLLLTLPVLLSARGLPVAVAGIVPVGMGTGSLFPLASTMVLSAAGPASTRASGATMTVASIGVLTAPLTIGAAAQGAGLRTALVVAAALPVAALVLLVVARR